MLDIDHFKLYNDRYRHIGGDDCLRKVGQTINAMIVRSSDLLYVQWWVNELNRRCGFPVRRFFL